MARITNRIVCDFDDTLAMVKDRDWENATPNLKLIEKLNRLYDEGWTIDIFTARGSISCNSYTERLENNFKQIEDWLKKHNVKYHTLSFDKPYAEYYIDDKAIKPEEFIKENI